MCYSKVYLNIFLINVTQKLLHILSWKYINLFFAPHIRWPLSLSWTFTMNYDSFINSHKMSVFRQIFVLCQCTLPPNTQTVPKIFLRSFLSSYIYQNNFFLSKLVFLETSTKCHYLPVCIRLTLRLYCGKLATLIKWHLNRFQG